MIRRTSVLSLVALMILIISCTAAPTVAPSIPTPMPTTPPGVQIYSIEEADISIQYPEGWIMEKTRLEDFNAMIFRETVEENAPELTVLSRLAEGQDAGQVLKEVLPLIQALGGEAKKDWQTGEAEEVTVGERRGKRILAEYTHVGSSSSHKVYLVGIVANDVSYAFVADAPLDRWDQNWPVFEAMLDSLRFGVK